MAHREANSHDEVKRRTNVTCNQKKRSKATKTSIAMLLLWLYVVAVAVPRDADCTFMDGASSWRWENETTAEE